MKNLLPILKRQLLLILFFSTGLAQLNSHRFLTDSLFSHTHLLSLLGYCPSAEELHSSSLRASDEETIPCAVLADWLSFAAFFFPFLYVLVAMPQCQSCRWTPSQIQLSDSHSSQQLSRNLTLINICQLLIIKSLKAECLLLTLMPKSWFKIK